jgi:hypothetical protein
MSGLAYAQMLTELLPTLLTILAAFGLLFAVVATVAMHFRGPRGVWIAWAVFVPLICGACVYKLSGLAAGAPGSITHAGYYGLLALAVIGLPLWCAARGLILLAARRTLVQRHWQALAAWALGMAAAPAGLLAMFAVEALAATLRR